MHPSLSHRSERWRLRSRTLHFSACPLVMGVVNVTPDSFSDGGNYFEPAAGIERGLELAAAGASIVDVGGESTRPYSQPVEEAEELRRVVPVVAALAEQGLVVSIDTSKAAVARESLDAGAEIVNDVTALTGDEGMLSLVIESDAGVCAMHMQGTPRTMQDDPRYEDVVADVAGYLRQRREAFTAAGVDPQRIALDPGIGFGKTHQHNLTLLANCHRFHGLGCPLLLGPSRKGFIGNVLGDKQADRTAGTIGVVLSLAAQGVQMVRVHDVQPVVHALRLFAASGGITGDSGARIRN